MTTKAFSINNAICFFIHRELDSGLEKPVASILWAAPRLQAEVQELRIISDELAMKYGKEFAKSCRSNQLANVDEKLMHKLSVEAPPRLLVEKYLEEIARTYNVRYIPDVDNDEVLTADRLLVDFEDQKGNNNNYPNNQGGGGGQAEVMKPINGANWQPEVNAFFT